MVSPNSMEYSSPASECKVGTISTEQGKGEGITYGEGNVTLGDLEGNGSGCTEKRLG